MANRRSVVINGDLGSGKSTVSKLLATSLGIRRISVGELYRSIAAQRGMTALQLNLHAELDEEVDLFVDQLQRDIAATGEQLVVDSRLAWHFFADALKVHLVTDPKVAAVRALDRPDQTAERYTSVEEAGIRLASRSESERIRFLEKYGADKSRLRNYNLVCDSTRATPDDIVERIVDCLDAPDAVHPLLFLDPRRIHPTAAIPTSDGVDAEGMITVGYLEPDFFAIDGHRQLITAIQTGQTLVAAVLVAEADEEISGVPCRRYFSAHATRW